MPPSRWPGTEQKNVYSPGCRLAENSDVPPPWTTSPFSLTPLPSTAMSCGTDCGFSDVTRTSPAGALASANWYARPAAATGMSSVPFSASAVPSAWLAPTAARRPGIVALLGHGLRDVGRDVAGVVALDELGGHQRQPRLAGPSGRPAG